LNKQKNVSDEQIFNLVFFVVVREMNELSSSSMKRDFHAKKEEEDDDEEEWS
jgi:hypothetical protein